MDHPVKQDLMNWLLYYIPKKKVRFEGDSDLAKVQSEEAVWTHCYFFPRGDKQAFVWPNHGDADEPFLKTINLSQETNTVLKKYRKNPSKGTVTPIDENDGKTLRKSLYLGELGNLYVLHFPLSPYLLEVVYAVNLERGIVEVQVEKFENFLQKLLEELEAEFEEFRTKIQSEEKEWLLGSLEQQSERIVLARLQQMLGRAKFNSLFLVHHGRILPPIEVGWGDTDVGLVYKITPSQYKLMCSNTQLFLNKLRPMLELCLRNHDYVDCLTHDAEWVMVIDKLHECLCEQFLNESATCSQADRDIASALLYSTAALREAKPEYRVSSEELPKEVLTAIESAVSKWLKTEYKVDNKTILERWNQADKTFENHKQTCDKIIELLTDKTFGDIEQEERDLIIELLTNLLTAILVNDEVQILEKVPQKVGIGASVAKAIVNSKLIFPQIIYDWREDPRVKIEGPQDVYAIEKVHLRQSPGDASLEDAIYLPVFLNGSFYAMAVMLCDLKSKTDEEVVKEMYLITEAIAECLDWWHQALLTDDLADISLILTDIKPYDAIARFRQHTWDTNELLPVMDIVLLDDVFKAEESTRTASSESISYDFSKLDDIKKNIKEGNILSYKGILTVSIPSLQPDYTFTTKCTATAYPVVLEEDKTTPKKTLGTIIEFSWLGHRSAYAEFSSLLTRITINNALIDRYNMVMRQKVENEIAARRHWELTSRGIAHTTRTYHSREVWGRYAVSNLIGTYQQKRPNDVVLKQIAGKVDELAYSQRETADLLTLWYEVGRARMERQGLDEAENISLARQEWEQASVRSGEQGVSLPSMIIEGLKKAIEIITNPEPDGRWENLIDGLFLPAAEEYLKEQGVSDPEKADRYKVNLKLKEALCKIENESIETIREGYSRFLRIDLLYNVTEYSRLFNPDSRAIIFFKALLCELLGNAWKALSEVDEPSRRKLEINMRGEKDIVHLTIGNSCAHRVNPVMRNVGFTNISNFYFVLSGKELTNEVWGPLDVNSVQINPDWFEVKLDFPVGALSTS